MARKKDKDNYRIVPAIVVPVEGEMYRDIERICKSLGVSPEKFATTAIRYFIQELNEERLILQKIPEVQ